MTEIWKPVPLEGYCENYEISNFGNVRRLKDAPFANIKKGDKVAFRRQKTKSAHLQVSLCHHAKYAYPLVHRLVMMAFGPPPHADGLMVCHCDGNAQNNHISNLRWDDALGNAADARLHGALPIGSRRWNAKLTEEAVRDIRKLVAQGVKQRDLAKHYGVSNIVISFAVNRKRWKHVD